MRFGRRSQVTRLIRLVAVLVAVSSVVLLDGGVAGGARAAESAAAGAPETQAQVTAGPPTSAPSGGSEFEGGVWKTVFRDNFNGPGGSGVNPSSWKYDTGQGVFGTGEIETMTSSTNNVHLDGHGHLDITALGHGRSWTSGRIQTKSAGFAAPAGGEMKVTASILQPDPSNGLGYWPAFWMLGPGDWPSTGEVDILEDVNALSQHSGTFHCGNLTVGNPDGTLGPCHEFTGLSSGLLPCIGCQTDYHTYTAVIDRRQAGNEEIRWYLDGDQFLQVSEHQVDTTTWTDAVDHGFSIIFDLAIGGSYPDSLCHCTSPDDQTTSGGTMSVRYVAVYERGPREQPPSA
jgi:beta-glucanase (GH16 family)